MARIRLGMVGGGQGGFIGAVHRIAARLDDEFELVAGALSSDPIRALDSAKSIGIVEARAYTSYRRMAETEAKRPDGIEAVVIVTPNDSHADIATIFLNHGIHVICDKPLAVSVEQARMLGAAAAKSGKILAVTYNYRGYPLIRQARAMCISSEIGTIRLVEVEYLQDWLAEESKSVAQRARNGGPTPSGPAALAQSAISVSTHSIWRDILRDCGSTRSVRSSRVLFREDGSTTTHAFFCGLKAGQKGYSGPPRSRSVTKTDWQSESMAIEAAWNGTNRNQTSYGIRGSDHRHRNLREAVPA